MVTCLYVLFYIYLITFTSTSCSNDFDIDDIAKFSCENRDFDFDEEVTSFTNDFHYSLEYQVQNALQSSPIWFTETDDTKNESEASIKEGESYEMDNLPEVIDDLSTTPFKIIKRRWISGSLGNDCEKDNFRKDMQEIYRKKSRIPSEYDEINIDLASISRTEYIENPDIVDNIQFKLLSEDQHTLTRTLSTKPLKNLEKPLICSQNRNYSRNKFFKEILERFRKETGQTEAKNIIWKLLDKSRLPSQYHGIEIDSDSMSRAEYFENLDIVDNIHFKPFAKDRPNLKKRKTNVWIDADNSEIVDSENVMEGEEKYEFNNSSEVIDNLSAGHHLLNRRKHFRKNMLERFRIETGQLEAKIINWKLLDRSRIPSEYDGIEIDSILMTKTEYFENPDIVDNIHFKQYTENQPALKECKTNVCIDVHYSEIDDAENKSADEIEQEKHEINYSPEVINHHTVRPPILYNPLHDRRIKFRINLLDRFQKETGQMKAKNINWKLLDRSRIPSEYDGIEIDCVSMSRTKYFENPNIVDNIHFKRFTEDQLDSKADASNIVPVDIKRRLLEIFCTDLGRPNASSIIWDRIDSDRLPEKYKNILLTSRTVYGQKFYEDPEFMENVHFKPYNKKKSKN